MKLSEIEFTELCEITETESKDTEVKPPRIYGLGIGVCIHGSYESNVDSTLTVNWLTHEVYDADTSHFGYGFYKVVRDIVGSDCFYESETELVIDVNSTLIKGLIMVLSETSPNETMKAIYLLNRYLEDENFEAFAGENCVRYRLVFMKDLSKPVETTEGGYFKLEALSTDKVILRKDPINLDGLFGNLKIVGWVGNTLIDLDWLENNKMELIAANRYPALDSIDFLPRMIHKVVPTTELEF